LFIRHNDRCPAKDFLEKTCEKRMRNRFYGAFQAIVNQLGATYYNPQRFKPLHGSGKPLWEFKEQDHRLYCLKDVIASGVDIYLFNGWVKDKAGKAREEERQIQTAQTLLNEHETEEGQ
jgi:hypothetical protein